MIENTISINQAQGDLCIEQPAQETDNGFAGEERTESTTAETAQEYTESAEENCEENSDAENTHEAEEILTLNVYGETVSVPKQQAIRAAQMGMAFDAMKGKMAIAKNDARLAAIEEAAALCDKTVPQLIAEIQGRAISDNLCRQYGGIENVPNEEIHAMLRQIESCRENLEQAPKSWLFIDRHNQLQEFLHNNPGCVDIPPQVISRAQQGENLSLAYSRYQNEQLTEKLEQLEKELNILKSDKKAKEKSMPSQRSTGGAENSQSVYSMMKSMW